MLDELLGLPTVLEGGFDVGGVVVEEKYLRGVLDAQVAVDGLVDAGVGLSEAEVVGIEDVLEAAGEFGIGAEAQAALDFVDVNSVGVAQEHATCSSGRGREVGPINQGCRSKSRAFHAWSMLESAAA